MSPPPHSWSGPYSLSDVCAEIRSGFWGKPEPSPERPVPVRVVRNGDIERTGALVGAAERYFTESEAERAQVHPGDVLFTGSGDIGKVHLAVRSDLYVSNFVRKLRPSTRIAPGFLYYLCQSPPVVAVINKNSGGSTIRNLRRSFFSDRWFYLPPLEEQQRIVTILEDHLSRLDAATASLSSADRRLSSLGEAFTRAELLGRSSSTTRRVEPRLAEVGLNDGDLEPLPAGWKWSRLGDLADVVGGVTKDSKRQSDPGFVEVPYLRVANVQRGRLDLGRVITIRVPPSKAAALELLPGDVLLNEGGDRDKLGRGWIWEGQIPHCIHQNHVFRARVRDAAIHPRLLSWSANVLGGPWCDRNAAQSVNLASISLTKIRQMPVPVPPPDRQAPIVQRISAHLDSHGRHRAEVADLSHRAQGLRRALLEAAFSGALTARSSDAASAREVAGV